MKTIDLGTPRLARLLGDAPLRVQVNGSVVPWDKHTAVTITREAHTGRAGDTYATAQLTITADTLTDIPRRAWLLIDLTPAALTELGGSTVHRYRFAGRITDVTLSRQPGGAPRYELTAGGTLATMRNPAVRQNLTTWAAQTLSTYTDPDTVFPPTTDWVAADFELSYTSPVVGPRLSDTTDDAPPLRDVLAAIVDSNPGGLLSEDRDGSIRFTTAGHGTVATVPAPAAGLEFPRTWPVNDATVTYGPAPDGAIVMKQLVRNPNADGSATQYSAIGGTLSWATSYVQATEPTRLSTLEILTNANVYDPTTDGRVRAEWWLQTGPNTNGSSVCRVYAEHYDGGTLLRQDELATFAGSGNSTWSNRLGGPVLVPESPAGTNSLRFRVRLPSGFVAADGDPALRIQRMSLITVGPGEFTTAELEIITDFDGDTPAGDGLTYVWTGTADASESHALANGPRTLTARATDAGSVDAYGITPERRAAYIDADYPAAAYALAQSMLTAAAWEPPPFTLDVLGLLENGDAAAARDLLALELGARVAVDDLPAGLPDDLTDPAACYVAGITETISAGSWRITIDPALIP